MNKTDHDSAILKDRILEELCAVFLINDIDALPDRVDITTIPEWNSLGHIDLLISLQNRFNISFRPEAMSQTLSLDGLTEIISQQLGLYSAENSANEICSEWTDVFRKLWEHDSLRTDDVIYIHSSTENISRLSKNVEFANIIDWLCHSSGANRTLILPAFPFTGRTIQTYIATHPDFDVKVTPASTGLLPEIVRNMEGAVRSAHPLLSECSIGPRAEWLLKDSHKGEYPFHKGSSYEKLLECDACMIGLGVNINTNAIIHMADDAFSDRYHFPLYTLESIPFSITFSDNTLETREYYAYSPEMTRHIKPQNIRPFFKNNPNILIEFEIDGINFYRLRIRPFIEACKKIASDSFNNNQLPPWHTDLAGTAS